MHAEKSTMSRLWRIVALFFLAFAALDLASPEVCAEELGGLPPSLVEATGSCKSSHDIGIGIPSDPCGGAPADEDCFCCCAHIFVRPSFASAIEPLPTLRLSSPRVLVRAAMTPPPYRPPRTA